MKDYLTHSDLLRGAPIDYDKVGKVTAESVLKHTGKNWRQWVNILKKSGARAWTYQEIAAFLKKRHSLTPWWRHGVALGFEIATGRRKAGQDANGKYMVTATKSLSHNEREVWNALISSKGQRLWLKPFSVIAIRPMTQFETTDGYFGEVRTVTQFRRVRLFWQDPLWQKHTVLELVLVPKPEKKSILVFNHIGIQDTETQATLRGRWRKVADQVIQLLD
ncbi:MAG: hypothetical protein AABZ55_07880 [Bdellovibrionota bacterium]